jgi:flagellar biosynthesis protein FlhF
MKVQRFVAPNSREALAMARAELGAEAVVLSSRQTASGFELLALAKGDIATLVNSGREQDAHAAPHATSAKKTVAERAKPVVAPVKPSPAAARTVRSAAPQPWVAPQSAPAAPVRAPVPAQGPDPQLLEEIRALRSVVEEQSANLTWMHNVQARPLRMQLMREMMLAGFSPILSRRVTDALPDDFSPEAARLWMQETLARNLHCAGPEGDVFERGGVFALVGPTGVGKTTTTAKLAAGCVVKHGAASLGMISADHYRIGAQDQLRIYGRILGVPVHAVHDAESLRAALDALAGKRLVLIDSIGVGQRDPRVAEQSALFDEQKVARVLLLSAASQAETLDEVVGAYGAQRLAGAILTKVDEAVSLGGALDCAIRRRLTVSHITNGQRVPEDIRLAQAAYLVHRGLSTSRTSPFRMEPKELELLALASPGRATPVAATGLSAHAGA